MITSRTLLLVLCLLLSVTWKAAGQGNIIIPGRPTSESPLGCSLIVGEDLVNYQSATRMTDSADTVFAYGFYTAVDPVPTYPFYTFVYTVPDQGTTTTPNTLRFALYTANDDAPQLVAESVNVQIAAKAGPQTLVAKLQKQYMDINAGGFYVLGQPPHSPLRPSPVVCLSAARG